MLHQKMYKQELEKQMEIRRSFWIPCSRDKQQQVGITRCKSKNENHGAKSEK